MDRQNLDQTHKSGGANYCPGFEPQSGDPEHDLYPDQAGIILRDRRSRRRSWRWVLVLFAPVIITAVIALGGYLYLEKRLADGPVELTSLGPRIAASLSARAGQGYTFAIGKALLQKEGGRPSIIIDTLSLTGPDNATILSAPKAIVSLDWLALLTGSVLPKRLAVAGLDLHVTVLADGGLGVSAANAAPAIVPGSPKPAVLPLRPGADGASGQASDKRILTAEQAAAVTAVNPGLLLSRAFKQLFALIGEHGSIGSLRHIGITRGRLIFNDTARGRKTVFNGLDMDIAHSGNSVTLDVSAEGSRGRWRMTMEAENSAAIDVKTELANITLDEIVLITGARNLPIDFDNILAGDIRFQLARDGAVVTANAKLSAGPGILILRDKDFEPLIIDAISSEFRWDSKKKTVTVDSLQYHGGANRIEFKGVVRAGKGELPAWHINLETSGPAHVAHQTINDASVALNKIKLAITHEPHRSLITFQQISITAKDVHLLISGKYDYTVGKRRMELTGQMDASPIVTVKSIWPSYIAPPVRAWVMPNLNGGMLESMRVRLMFDERAFAAIAARKPLPENSSDITYSLSGATLHYMKGARPLSNVRARGHARGPVNDIEIQSAAADLGNRRTLQLSAGRLQIRDLGDGLLKVALKHRMTGVMSDVSTLLDQPGFAAFNATDIDFDRLRGKIDAHLDMKFRTSRKKIDPEFVFSAKARLTSLNVEKFAGDAALENANLDLVIRKGALSAKGSGKLYSTPVQVKMVKPAGRPAKGTIELVLDDAARKRMGWDMTDLLTGPVKVKINGTLGKHQSKPAGALKGRVALDLTRAAIRNVAPGLAKSAGEAAVASLNLTIAGKSMIVKDLNYRSAGLSARGALEFGKNQRFIGARLTRLKMSPGDDLRADIRNGTGGLQIKLTGPAIDLRPLISGKIKRPRHGKTSKVSLSINTGIATGFNGQILSGFQLALTKNAQGMSSFALKARAGRSPVNGALVQRTNDGPLVEITGSDGGTILSFLNVYSRMRGGQLRLRAKVNDNGISGYLDVRKFLLRNEKALRQLVAQGGQQANRRAGRRIDTSAVAFQKLQFGFVRNATSLQIRNGVLSGPEIGLTLAGVIDFRHNRVAMNGTFVPAYGLNNVFARIPLFGPILGGSKNEGLLGVNFRVSGRPGKPVLTVNPLSAIAPGFLRKIFGAFPPQAPR